MRYSPFLWNITLSDWNAERLKYTSCRKEHVSKLLILLECGRYDETKTYWTTFWNFVWRYKLTDDFHYLNCIRMLKMLCSSKSNFRNTKMIHLEKNKMSFITSHAITNCQFPSSFIAGKTRLYDSGFYDTAWVNNCTNVNKMDGILHGKHHSPCIVRLSYGMLLE